MSVSAGPELPALCRGEQVSLPASPPCAGSSCPCPELLSPPGALFQMWTSVSPTRVRTEPPASMVLATSAAGARRASEAPTARPVSAGPPARQGRLFAALEEWKPQAWGALPLFEGGSLRPGLLQQLLGSSGLRRPVGFRLAAGKGNFALAASPSCRWQPAPPRARLSAAASTSPRHCSLSERSWQLALKQKSRRPCFRR